MVKKRYFYGKNLKYPHQHDFLLKVKNISKGPKPLLHKCRAPMIILMLFQRIGVFESLLTLGAAEWPFIAMNDLVPSQGVRVFEFLINEF